VLGLGDLVEKTLDCEGVAADADTPQRTETDARLFDDMLGELVRDRILRQR